MVAEMSGTLPTTLRWHAELLSRQQALRHSLLGALIYPGIILVGTVVTSSFLILYAFPKIVPLFRGFHTKLPFTTRTLIWISTPSSTHSEYLLLGLMVPLVLGVVLSYSKTARRHTYRATLRLPLIGGLMREYTLTTLFTMLALLLQSGIRMDVAIELLRKTTSRSLFKESLLHMQNTVLAGGKLSQSMRSHTLLYPSLYIELIAAGEESGSLVESTQTAAHLCETSLEERLHALSVLVEPTLMILLGFVVGFVALAIISPMYSLTQTLSTT